MPKTLAEATTELEKLKQKRGIWIEVVDHLLKYVNDEVRCANRGILAEGCISQTVPQEMISDFVYDVRNGEMKDLTEKIEGLESLPVLPVEAESKHVKEEDPKTARKSIKPKSIHAGPAGRKKQD